MPLAPGQNIGHYRIVEQIGRGGMATVFKAYQPSLSRHVAIKVLPSLLVDDPQFLERFRQEAKAVGSLDHPNILPIYDFDEEDGLAYIVTKLVDGGTLSDKIGPPLPVDYCVHVTRPVAAALDYAHRAGIVHRDVKPSNVLMHIDGTPVLADFGLAKMFGNTARLTSTGMTAGTPEYMAPEQALGQEVGPAADVYALSATLYEMLTAAVPFSAETPLAVALAQVHDPLPLPRERNPDLSETVEQVLLKGLAKQPEDRFASAGEMVEALADAIANGGGGMFGATRLMPSAAPNASAAVVQRPAALPVLPSVSKPRRGGILPAAAGVLLLLLLAGLGGGAFTLLRGTLSGRAPAQAAPTAQVGSQAPAASVNPPPLKAAATTLGGDGLPPHGEVLYELKGDGSNAYVSRSDAQAKVQPAGDALDLEAGKGGQFGPRLDLTGLKVSNFVAQLQFRSTAGGGAAVFTFRQSGAGNTAVHQGVLANSGGAVEIQAGTGPGPGRALSQAGGLPVLKADTNLVVLASGPDLVAYVNGKEATRARDATSAEGEASFTIQVSPNSPVNFAVRLAGLKVWALPAGS